MAILTDEEIATLRAAAEILRGDVQQKIARMIVDADMVDPNGCYHRALPGEPRFTILARDPLFYYFVSKWACLRANAVACGDRPESDMDRVSEALQMAVDGAEWRRANNGKWRS